MQKVIKSEKESLPVIANGNAAIHDIRLTTYARDARCNVIYTRPDSTAHSPASSSPPNICANPSDT